MGTLTGETPYFPDQCDHKLPSSCRLTASPKCCACQDIRPHTPLYTIYVDGVGLVQRGTRWQRYCFFCKEFWQNRVAATQPPMLPQETRIPEHPDQSLFIQRWFEFHRGYRLVVNQDTGVEERHPVRCEKPWRDVDPGTLPMNNLVQRHLSLAWTRSTPTAVSEDVPSLDAALDDLIADANQEQPSSPATALPRSTRAQTPISITQEISEESIVADATSRFNEARRRHILSQLKFQRAECELQSARAELRNDQAEMDLAQREMARAQARIDRQQAAERRVASSADANQRAAQRIARVFGTREEIERQGAEYVSPLTSLFTRAYERYRVAEDVRAAERAVRTNAQLQGRITVDPPELQIATLARSNSTQLQFRVPDIPFRTLDDGADDRPPPKTAEEMTVALTCKICLQQIADVAVLPCGHLVMCSFCADIWIPARPNDDTQPSDGRAQCPLCRKRVKRRARIYTS